MGAKLKKLFHMMPRKSLQFRMQKTELIFNSFVSKNHVIA
ncbi:hypothetical protein P872_01900 [Rhodonellum psychrophilum GCM71 = DSM 17998]|uniref:Transposase n=1 Tax=Rhodonellum psychrophilum GCM71 = DSM 17998 TaxID=1123057 RepID=U5C6G4_9BACT|nr:hypothetical protein P872_01900 [Rhodonellum psychrophilum GCM71 = DSM 17998]